MILILPISLRLFKPVPKIHFISVTLIKINPLPFPFPSSPKALVLGYGAANVDLRLLVHKIFSMS